jgi:hypothetical protein
VSKELEEKPVTFGGATSALEQEQQVSVGNGNDVQDDVDFLRPSERDPRRGMQMDIERIIAAGLASIREDPDGRSHEAQAAGEQNPDRRLQIVPPSPSQVRIEFKIL